MPAYRRTAWRASAFIMASLPCWSALNSISASSSGVMASPMPPAPRWSPSPCASFIISSRSPMASDCSSVSAYSRPRKEKNTSNTVSNTRQWLAFFTSVAASAYLNASRSSSGMCCTAAMASRFSVKLTGSPATRSSAMNPPSSSVSATPAPSSARRVDAASTPAAPRGEPMPRSGPRATPLPLAPAAAVPPAAPGPPGAPAAAPDWLDAAHPGADPRRPAVMPASLPLPAAVPPPSPGDPRGVSSGVSSGDPGGPGSAIAPRSRGRCRLAAERGVLLELLGRLRDVALVLEQDVRGARRRRCVDLLDAEQQERARPVDRLGHRGRLLQLELPDRAHDAGHLVGQGVGDAGNLREHDLALTVQIRVVDVEEQAAPLQRLGQLAGVVRREEHEGDLLGRHRAQLGDRHLVVGEDLEQQRLGLDLDPVH